MIKLPKLKTVRNKCGFCNKPLVQKLFTWGKKETPLQLSRRKFCGLECNAGSQRGVWKVKNPKWMASHHRARRVLKKIGICEVCEKKHEKTDIHHIDNDWQNNDITNLQEICRGCHIRHHRKQRNEKREITKS